MEKGTFSSPICVPWVCLSLTELSRSESLFDVPSENRGWLLRRLIFLNSTSECSDELSAARVMHLC